MSRNVQVVIIDPQHDFCDPKGALSVGGALEAMNRVADMVLRIKEKIDDIHITLDSHHPIHIAHPIYWRDQNGNHPAPFTIITSQDIKDNKWFPYRLSWRAKAEAYVKQLESNKRYPLCIWPPHCLIGSVGHTVVPKLWNAVTEWENSRFGMVNYITKGSNPNTEHYSAIQADVPDPKDPSTQLNTEFLNMLVEADDILATGIAGSHCLANTLRDIVQYFNNPDFIKKIVFLTDATAPVGGFEHLQDQVIKDLSALGMRTATTKDILA
jgi:nicotinamidase-related amidase